MKLITLALVATGSVALFANGGNQSTATAEVAVKIVAPICIVNPNQSKLDFGMVTVNDATQPIAIAWVPDMYGSGTLGYTNCDPYADATSNGPSSFAWFHIRKDHDLGWNNVNVTVPATVVLGTGVQVATKSSPWDFCYTLNGLPVFLSNTTGDDMKHFYVGGTLTAAANTFGTFSKTMTVTANYQ
jgi:hypothetical protein